MTTINNTLTLLGHGLYASNSRQVAFLKSSPGFRPSRDPNNPTHTTLAANLTPDANTIVLGNISSVPIPNQNVGQYGSLRVGSEIIVYSEVFAGNSSVDIIQRNVGNTGNLNANVNSGSLVSVLGTRTIPISRRVYTYLGNLVFTSSNIGLGYYSANVGATISSPDLESGNTAVIGSIYLWANGAVQALSITNAGTGYFSNPVISITGPNAYAFSGTADLTTL
jgi:hypothetical protein